jgi:hypothetical protein
MGWILIGDAMVELLVMCVVEQWLASFCFTVIVLTSFICFDIVHQIECQGQKNASWNFYAFIISKKCWHCCIKLTTKSYNVHYGGEAWCLIPSLGRGEFLWENPFIQISSKCINQPFVWFVWFNTIENLIWKINLRLIP